MVAERTAVRMKSTTRDAGDKDRSSRVPEWDGETDTYFPMQDVLDST